MRQYETSRTDLCRRHSSADLYEQVTQQIISALETGVIPWRQNWKDHRPRLGQHRNAISKRKYTGVNAILLLLSNRQDPRWVTFKQARELGGHVRKGEKSTPVIFTKKLDVKEKDEEGKETGAKVKTSMLRFYHIFNLEQVENHSLGEPEDKVKPTLRLEQRSGEADELSRKYLEREGITFEEGAKAAYSKRQDKVIIPPFEYFNSPEGYYITLYHELTHSTGHKSRLNRPEVADRLAYDDESYSKEELVAELGSAFLMAELGMLAPELENTTAYIANWLKALKNDKRLIISASARASRATEFILGTT